MCKTAIYILTPQGTSLIGPLRKAFPESGVFASTSLKNIFGPVLPETTEFFSSLPALTAATFHHYACHIFVAAAGIAVRCIAPLLRSKGSDPAVLVIDQRGKFVISLLSGHLGGANHMAGVAAKALGAVPVITTATDLEGLPAIDSLAKERGLALAGTGPVKTISAALLAGKPAALCDPHDFFGLREGPFAGLFLSVDSPEEARGLPLVWVTAYAAHPPQEYEEGAREAHPAETRPAAAHSAPPPAYRAPAGAACGCGVQARRERRKHRRGRHGAPRLARPCPGVSRLPGLCGHQK